METVTAAKCVCVYVCVHACVGVTPLSGFYEIQVGNEHSFSVILSRSQPASAFQPLFQCAVW